jgi:hypothetical protein
METESRERERFQRKDIPFKNMTPVTSFSNKVPPPGFPHLTIMPSSYEFINRLIHWLDYSP